MDVLFPVSAGLDVHRDTVVASIRKRDERGRERVETRTFETFADALLKLVEWLHEHNVCAVGLESTGVYWKPVVQALRRAPYKWAIWLVNPAHVKKVPGRKTDVSDSQWLSKLVMYGLVSPSFLPDAELEEMRKLTRFRTRLVSDETSCTNRILKELESSGIKLASICSDALGKSGRAMIDALLEGTKTPEQIADLARGRLRCKRAELQRAVSGSLSDATRLVLRMLLARLDQTQRDQAALDEQIQQKLQAYQPQEELLLMTPGLDRILIAAVLAETGVDMSVFETADRIAAWGGLSPGSNESAGKAKNARSRKGDKYLRTALVQAAWSAVHTRGTFWSMKFPKLVVRMGKKKAIVAIAHKMLVAIFYILRDGVPYKEPPAAPTSPEKIKRLVRHHTAQLAALGFDVTLAPVAAPAP